MKRRRSRSMGSLREGTETQLFIDNDEPLYRQKMAMWTNLIKKVCKKNFSPQKAKKLFRYLTTEANRRYKKDFGESLPVAERREAERDFVHEFAGAVKRCRRGNCGELTAEQTTVLKKCSR